MGTGLMQRTAAEMVECDAIDCCGFVFYVCAHTIEDGCELTTPDPSALILSVKFCDQETGTNLYTQERNKRFSTLQLLASSVWRHLSCSPFYHVLSGAISIITRAGTRAHVHFVTMFGDPSVDQQTQKTWPDTSTPHRPPSR
jgi:hypothetical protein